MPTIIINRQGRLSQFSSLMYDFQCLRSCILAMFFCLLILAGCAFGSVAVALASDIKTESGSISWDKNKGIVTGKLSLSDDYEIAEDQELTIPEGAILETSARLLNKGTITILGTLVNKGSFENQEKMALVGGRLDNEGTFKNRGGVYLIRGAELHSSTSIGSQGVILVFEGTLDASVYNESDSDDPAVIFPFRIIEQPKDMAAPLGGSATFSVKAQWKLVIPSEGIDEEGEQYLRYQWQESKDGGKTFTDIEGANSAHYTVESVAQDMDGRQYRCSILTEMGSHETEAATFSLEVMPQITTESLPNATTGKDYSVALAATGGNVNWSLKEGSKLPQGLSLDQAAGVIFGKALTAGVYSLSFVASNSAGSTEKTLSLKVEPEGARTTAFLSKEDKLKDKALENDKEKTSDIKALPQTGVPAAGGLRYLLVSAAVLSFVAAALLRAYRSHSLLRE